MLLKQKGNIMIKELIFTLAISVIVASPSFAMAKEGCGGLCSMCHTLTEKEANTLLSKIGGTVKSVKEAPAKGLFELFVEKDDKQGIIYVDFGKKHLLQGMIVNLETLQPVMAHAMDSQKPKQVTRVDLATIPVARAFIIGNPKGTKKIYVFTDPDCPYCRNSHTELKKLATIAPDVAIHIMLFPLAMHPAAFDKSRAVLETMNAEVLDRVFEGKSVPTPAKEESRKAIDEIIAFGKANGISGTPTLIMPDGTVELGMPDAETLKKILEGKKISH